MSHRRTKSRPSSSSASSSKALTSSSSSAARLNSKKEEKNPKLLEFFDVAEKKKKKKKEIRSKEPTPTPTPSPQEKDLLEGDAIEEHEEFKQQLKRFLIEHTPVYGIVALRYGFLAAFVLWLVLSFGVFGYVYKAVTFGALCYENDRAPEDDLIVVEKLMDARMDHYVTIPLDKKEPIVRHHIPLWEMVNARYHIVKASAGNATQAPPPLLKNGEIDEASFLEHLANQPKRQEYESSFWQCFSMVHVIGAGMIQVVIVGIFLSAWIFYYVVGYRVFALFKNIPWVVRVRENPSLFMAWYIAVGLIGFGYVYKIAVYAMAVFNTAFNSREDAFTVADLGLDPENYNAFLSFASASFSIISDSQGVRYYSNSFWCFWDGAHILGAIGVQAIVSIAIPIYKLAALLFWSALKLAFRPVLGQYRHVKGKLKRE